ncbi:MAG: TolC family protein [Planctomycetota bacterium]|nr:TolC family protein [Planctomycetota bacterium]
MTFRAHGALIALTLLAGGCASGPLDDSAWPAPRPLGQGLESIRPPYSPDEAFEFDSVAEPTGIMSLRDALAAALLRSPNLMADGYEVRAREAEALQAGLMPNPELSAEFENFGGSGELSGTDKLESTLSLSQLVELGGKRVKRRNVANREARLAGWLYEIRRIDVLSKTASDYVGLLASERRLRIAIETQELAKRVHNVIDERVNAGKVSPVERNKAQVELALAKLGLNQAQREVMAARTRLASNWGSPDPQFESLVGDLEQLDAPPTLDSLLSRVEQNPDLARWAAESSLRQAEVELALSQRRADLTISGGVRYFEEINETAFVAGISMPLMVFDQNQGGIQAARLRVLQGGHLEEANRVQIRMALVVAFQILDGAYFSVHIIRDEVLPNAERSFEAAEEAFREGKIGALDLLDAERTLFEGRRLLTDALTTYHLAVIAGERLIGAPLHEEDQPEGIDP